MDNSFNGLDITVMETAYLKANYQKLSGITRGVADFAITANAKAVALLALESKAKTYDGKRKANLKQERDVSRQTPDSYIQIASDLEVMRELYADEGNYQKARNAGKVGRVVIQKFLEGAIQ